MQQNDVGFLSGTTTLTIILCEYTWYWWPCSQASPILIHRSGRVPKNVEGLRTLVKLMQGGCRVGGDRLTTNGYMLNLRVSFSPVKLSIL